MSNFEKELFADGYQKTFIKAIAAPYQSPTPDMQDLDPDLMFCRFIMAHEGANANGDFFTRDVLQKAAKTPINKPIDWEHGQPIIGTILSSEVILPENNPNESRAYIQASGVIWKFIYPELAEEIKAKGSTNDLRLSMECYYKDATYRVGSHEFSDAEATKLGITNYVGREYMGGTVHRVFSSVIFGGVGVVANPADKDAMFLSIASRNPKSQIKSLHDQLHIDYANQNFKSMNKEEMELLHAKLHVLFGDL